MFRSVSCKVGLCVLLLGLVPAVPVFAGSAVIGSVAGTMNATIGGQALAPNTTVFSGDSLQVSDGVAVVAIDKSSRVIFGRQTAASFLRDSNEVTVLLSRGNLSLYHAQDGAALRVKVGEVTVEPAKGFKTLGEVAMVGGGIVITAREGSLRVAGSGSALEVAKGKTITIPTQSARAAKSAPARPAVGGETPVLEYVAAGGGALAAILAGISISRASDAKDAANAATAAANAATTAAQTADADAVAAAAAAEAAANAAGCATNYLSNDLGFSGFPGAPFASPYTPTGTDTCPAANTNFP